MDLMLWLCSNGGTLCRTPYEDVGMSFTIRMPTDFGLRAGDWVKVEVINYGPNSTRYTLSAGWAP
jgi:hypothetical protein